MALWPSRHCAELAGHGPFPYARDSEHLEGQGPKSTGSATAVHLRVDGTCGSLAVTDDAEFYLVAIEGRHLGRWIQLGAAPVTAGRDPHLEIVLSGRDVSRRHLFATVVDGGVVIEDLGSTNGTFIDGRRIERRAALPIGSVLRVGDHVFRCERCGHREIERAVQERRDLQRAAHYVRSLLTEPISDGPIRTEWMFRPSARLGGDAFGYEQLDARTFVIYLFDVCGHGVGAAMHSVSVLNVLREHALPHTDFTDPVQLLTNLNVMFQMDRHDDQYFTMWYGAYDAFHRTLTYATAGHHPAYLVPPDRAGALPLKTSGPMIGAAPDSRFHAARIHVPAGARLYLFSDGIFEIVTKDGRWCLDDFVQLLWRPIVAGGSECQRVYGAAKAACHPAQFEDDVSLLVVTVP
jgi:hypothetical protein